ncbi:MAG: tetratricopeptide repeat protein, partial [Mariprofundaceae bacterium]
MLLLLASCGGKQTHGVVDNPYLDRAHDFSVDGMASMQRERWSAAERAFSRALLAAQLSDDTRLVRLSWYNLGVVRSAMHHADEAEEAFRRCIELSRRQGDDVMRIRASLALALMQVQLKRTPATIEVRDSGLPADIYLQSGRLAQLQGRPEAADKAYHSAIAKSRRDAQGLKIRADAYMGLALLQHQAGNDAGAKKNVD